MKKLLLLLSLMYSVNTFAQSGCTDPNACNYDPVALVDDGSCAYLGDPGLVLGCTYPEACNYDPNATCDDLTCQFPYGCGNPLYQEYNPNYASCSDSTACLTLTIHGCIDATACNYDPSAHVDDGSCHYLFGCTDPVFCNYDATAVCDDGSCAGSYGCTDPLACN